MSFDTGTAITAIAIIALVSGGFLIVSGRQFHAAPTAAIWGLANLFLALAIPLLLNGDGFELGFLCVLINAALSWAAIARFNDRRVPDAVLLGACVLWIVVIFTPPTVLAYGEKTAVFMVMTSLLLAGCCAELWRSRDERLSSRWPLFAIIALDAGSVLIATTQVVGLEAPPELPGGGPLWVVYLMAMIFLVGTAVFLVSLIKERAIHEQERLAATDPLTSVPNRGSVMRAAAAALAASKTANVPLAVALFDLDRFKAINDGHGHRTGDAVLQHFAEVARRGLRSSDIVGRIGGEEFVAILPGATAEVAIAIANRVRAAFAEGATSFDGKIVRATVSCGVAVSEPGAPAASIDALLSRADAALYAAKGSGRDRVLLEAGAAVRPTPIVRIA